MLQPYPMSLEENCNGPCGLRARVYPVGRLDKDSEGLLILTNDGSFANALTHPKHNYAKVYRVTVRPSVNDEMLEKMRNGIEIVAEKLPLVI